MLESLIVLVVIVLLVLIVAWVVIERGIRPMAGLPSFVPAVCWIIVGLILLVVIIQRVDPALRL